MSIYQKIAYNTNFLDILNTLIRSKRYWVDEEYRNDIIYLYITTSIPNKKFIESSNALINRYAEYLEELDYKKMMYSII